jgi:hypothetical protein
MGVLFLAGRIGVGLRACEPRPDALLDAGFDAALAAGFAAGFDFPPSIFDHVGPDGLGVFFAAVDWGIVLHLSCLLLTCSSPPERQVPQRLLSE